MTAVPRGSPVTRADLDLGLARLGVRRGDLIEVHSSLSAFGWVVGGAATVVDALMAAVGEEGALVMSAYPVSKPLPLTPEERARGILGKVRLYHLSHDGPTGMGAVADEFRHRPGTVLGRGRHRVCAWGRDADALSEGYHRLLEADGLVLLLGVGINRCSSMHQAESAGLPPEIVAACQVPDEIRRDYPEDIFLAYGRTFDQSWERVLARAEARALVKRDRIGDAECLLFRAAAVVAIYETALREDPIGLFESGGTAAVP